MDNSIGLIVDGSDGGYVLGAFPDPAPEYDALPGSPPEGAGQVSAFGHVANVNTLGGHGLDERVDMVVTYENALLVEKDFQRRAARARAALQFELDAPTPVLVLSNDGRSKGG